jgi:hypothetical protein
MKLARTESSSLHAVRSSRSFRIPGWFWLVLVAVFATSGPIAQDLVRIDFRNKIPGVVDAPVYDFDGVSRLEGSRFMAALYAGPESDSLVALVHGTEMFLSGTDSGYWRYDAPVEVVPSFLPTLGQTIYYKVEIVEFINRFPFPEAVYVSRSKLYSMVITNTVMPMVGLESFKLEPERLEISLEGEQTVVRWRYLAASRYELQSTTSLQPPIAWTPIFDWSGIGGDGHVFSVTNASTALPQFYRLQRWRQSWE